MGDIKRKRKTYTRPKQLFDRARIDQENELVKRYGLKNKTEIWKASSLVSKFRRQAKDLIAEDIDKQKVLFQKLNKLGVPVTTISDILALNTESLLDRRLQTVIYKKKLANTPRQARQLIVHKHIKVDGQVVNIPSFWVTKDIESKIERIPIKLKAKEEVKPEEVTEASSEEEAQE